MEFKITLRNAVANGDIIHVQNTGDEFLRYKVGDEFKYSYLGPGLERYWKDQDGVVFEENGEYPDCVGGLSESNLYVQPNREVNNPLDGDEGWEDDWEIMPEGFRYKRANLFRIKFFSSKDNT